MRAGTDLVVGAGLAGLAAAATLSETGDGDVVLHERESRPGGHARSVDVGGYVFDEGPHILFPTDPAMREWIAELLGDAIVSHARRAYIVHDRHRMRTGFPFQAHLYGLPPEFVRDCLVGVIEAAERRAREGFSPTNYEEWIRGSFGDAIADEFMVPYARKIWTVEPSSMAFEWAARKVPTPNLSRIIEGALRREVAAEGATRSFWYPLEGGIETLPRALAGSVRELVTDSALVEVDLGGRRALFSGGEWVPYGRLLLSTPLSELPRYVPAMPDRVRRACAGLTHQGVRVVNLGFPRPRDADAHWLYFYEDVFPFHRASFPSAFSPRNAPEGHSSISVELAFPQGRPPDAGEAVERSLAALRRASILADDDEPDLVHTQLIEPAYPIYDRAREQHLGVIGAWLAEHDVHPIGRFGEWAYLDMDTAMASGVRAATAPRGRRAVAAA